MSSNINYEAIDVTYPIAGVDNSTQGFRDNFTAIRNGLATASNEIGALQTVLKTFDLVVWKSGKPISNEVIFKAKFPRTVTFHINFAGSTGVSVETATSSTTFSIKKNNVQIGTANFAAGTSVATFTLTTETSFEPTDIITISAPSTPDTTLSSISFILQGFE
jgi:hypothetical protein